MPRPKTNRHPIQARVSPETLAKLEAMGPSAGAAAGLILESWATGVTPETDEAYEFVRERLAAVKTLIKQPELGAMVARCEAGTLEWSDLERSLRRDLAAVLVAELEAEEEGPAGHGGSDQPGRQEQSED